MCYPRNIPANSEEPIQVNRGRNGDYRCSWGSEDATKHYEAARIFLDVEIATETYGRFKKKVALFASPVKEPTPASASNHGWLYCSDGVHTNEPLCGGPWEWGDPVGTGEWRDCDCDNGTCPCEDLEEEE